MKRYLLWLALGSLVFFGLAGILYFLLDSPSTPDLRVVRGKAFFETENYLSALQMLRNVPAGSSGPETHAYLGAAYLHLHLYAAALEQFQAASLQNPAVLDPWVGLAVVHLRLGDGQKALEGASKAIKVAENSPDAWLILARAHWLQKNLVEAEKAAMKVHSIDGRNLLATELLLRIYLEHGDSAKFQSLLDLTPEPNKPIEDLAGTFAVRNGEFRRAYELQVRFERRNLEAQILRSQLALKREPGQYQLYPSLIRNLIKVGRAEEAIAEAKSYRGELPLDFEMGKAHWLAGNREAAIQAYRKASAGRIHKLSAEVALAAITGDLNHWREAFRAERIELDHFVLAQLQEVIPSASPLVKAFAYRYAGLYDNEYLNRAARQALSILDTEPENFDALLTLSTAYNRLGRLDDSLHYVELAKSTHPNSAEVWSRLSEVALRKQEAGKAEEYMKAALRLEPRNPSYLYNLGWLLDQLERDAEAVPYYERAIASSSLSFEAMNNLALIEGSAGRSDRALDLLNQAVAANPENEAAYFNRATYYASQKAWKEALNDFEQVRKLDPVNVFASVEIGRIQLASGNTDRAIENLNKALEVDPNTYDAYLLMSSAYQTMNRSHEAEAAMAEAMRIQPVSPSAEKSTK